MCSICQPYLHTKSPPAYLAELSVLARVFGLPISDAKESANDRGSLETLLDDGLSGRLYPDRPSPRCWLLIAPGLVGAGGCALGFLLSISAYSWSACSWASI